MTVRSVVVLLVAGSTGIVMLECFNKSETIVEQHNTVDKLEQSKVVLRYEYCDIVAEDCCKVVVCEI